MVIRRAAELQARDSAHVPRSGMTLREMETIATEAGIDAKYLRHAAQNLAVPAPTTWQKLAGPPTHVTAQRSVTGEYDAEALSALVDAAQAEVGLPGTTRQVLGGVEWRGKGPMGPVQVTARPLGGELHSVVHLGAGAPRGLEADPATVPSAAAAVSETS